MTPYRSVTYIKWRIYPTEHIIKCRLLSTPGDLLYSKAKAIPLPAWRGPEGSRRLRLPDSKTIGT